MQSNEVDGLHIFDCDGVLLNSNSLKITAMRNALESVDCPIKFVDWAIDKFQSNFGLTRIQHFDTFMKYSDYNHFCLSLEKAKEANELYSKNVVSLYLDCEVISETIEFISHTLSNKNIYVVSASDQDELREILPIKIPIIEKNKILGGPISKTENLEKLTKLKISKLVYFYGDSVQDCKAAISNGINFIGLSKYSADPFNLEIFCKKENLDCYKHCLEVKKL